MNPENAIEVCNVTKYFKVYEDKGHMLRDRIIHFNRNKYEKREVLKNISFDIKKGESVGIIGKNGCGKSTTLKMLTRILRPNSGTITKNGRVYSLIELGAGFHPDMTGRENIYINASIFGIKAKEVDKKLDDIIRFSELEEYINNPVRTYSSGMYMRLAFAVAINVDADILLVDEILAVGDNAFQTKCFNKLKSLKDEGVTIVLVSHALGQVEKLCDRAIWLEHGEIHEDGLARQVCKDYLESAEEDRLKRAEIEYQQQVVEQTEIEDNVTQEMNEKEFEKRKKNLSCHKIAAQCGPDARRSGNGKAYFTEVKMLDVSDKEKIIYNTGEKIKIKMRYNVEGENQKLNFVIGITRSDWVFCYGAQTKDTLGTIDLKNGEIVFLIDEITLLAGEYYLDLWIRDSDETDFDCVHSLINFKITGTNYEDYGIMLMKHEWFSLAENEV